ncbi:MAG: cysteine desulfurase CsdA [Crocinitomicaceae bacterium]|nr:cysteine desulfurase CsdA [Crocinitomicaceae bacterium]|tara:strand:- start:2507 stop:3748 length:1242 start_codon:yes stop_codon:yes gene_type:complete
MNTTPLNIDKIRKDFPVLHQEVNGYPLVYMDNAASAQKPQLVIDTISHYYSYEHSNIHRGVHHLSAEATVKYEAARKTIQEHINASFDHEVIFTKGTTDGINLIANGFRGILSSGDEVIISGLEHHSNIVPWQMLCEYTGATLRVIPINDIGEIILEEYESLVSERTKLVALNHVSNTLGTINPVKELIELAHKKGAPVLLDGAQALPHMKVDVQDLDCEFYAFSGHKLYGPTGIGVLYGKEEWLNKLPPYQGGGDMIKSVSFEKTTYNELPFKFEAGTPHIAGALGLKAALDYCNQPEIGFESIGQYEGELLDYAMKQFESEGLSGDMEFYGTSKNKASVISFLLKGVHPYDTGTILDKLGIAVRTGHHCTEPIMDRYEIPGTVRASFSFYNTFEEVDRLIEGLKRVKKMFG